MNWSLLISVILEIVRKLLERKLSAVPVGATAKAELTDDEADRLATQLEGAIAAPKAGAVGHDGGIILHVQELITALRTRDWVAVWRVINDLIGHA